MAAPKKSTGKTATKTATKSAAKPAKKASGGNGATKQARGGLAKPVKPSAELAKVVGSGSLTRAEVTKKVWDYIRTNNLQDAQNRRNINADDTLKPIFGGKSNVSMFEMTKLVNQHLS